MSNWSPESVTSIAQTQWELIDSAFHALAPGGVMVYSTCTLNAQENQQVVLQLLATYGDAVSVEPLGDLFPQAQLALTPEGFLHVFPQIYDSEGFFVARLRKNHSVPALAKPSYKLGKFPFAPLSAQESSLVAQAAAASGLVWDETSKLWARDKEIWLFPAALEPLVSKVRFSRIGVKLAERFPKGFRWQHEAVIALAASGNPQTFELDAALAQEWFHGRDLYPSQPPQSNECIVTYQHQPLGLAKLIGSRIKNSLPRELVRDGVLDFHQ
jgi:16S rRNA (cytosine1407-C5)-methyltransferase